MYEYHCIILLTHVHLTFPFQKIVFTSHETSFKTPTYKCIYSKYILNKFSSLPSAKWSHVEASWEVSRTEHTLISIRVVSRSSIHRQKKLWCWQSTVLTRGLSISSVGEKWAQQSTSGRDVTSLPAVRRGLCYRLLPASNALPLVVRTERRSAASPMENQVCNRHTCAVDRKWSSSLPCVVATILWVWR